MGRGLSRRTVLQGMAAGAGLALAGGLRGPAVWAAPGVLPPGTRPDPSKPEGTDLLPQIDHIVIYMQENHSYDSYFGTLPKGDGYTMVGGVPTNSNPTSGGVPFPVFRATETCQLGVGVGQSWNSTHEQWNGGAMDGFHRNSGDNAMKYWDGGHLPFYRDLADTFVLCDRWFGSAPCQTYPNRRFLQAATSVGMVATDPQAVIATPNAPNGTIWERLNDQGISWLDYAFDLPDILLFPEVHSKNVDKIRTFQNFLWDAQAGTLPQVSIVSPGFETYTEENPHDVQLGEAYTARLVNAILQSPAWERTILVFTYDEHGGYYDHVPMPAAVAPDSIPPDIDSPPDAPGAFDLYGPRVPGLVISPFAKPGHVSSTVYDHTSILRLIETKWNLGALTYRDANANDLLDTLDLSSTALLDPPTLAAPGLDGPSACEPDVPDPKTFRAVRYEAPATTTTTTSLPGATTVPGPAPGAAAVPGQIAFTGPPDMTLPTVAGVSAVAAGFAVLAARHRVLARATAEPAGTDAEGDRPGA
jgi:phospholipase C